MKIVILESPYAGRTQYGTDILGTDKEVIKENVEYARLCMKDCLDRGEAPMVSHLLYTQVLDDDNEEQRQQGIDAGLAWRKVAEKSVVYIDKGISRGMWYGIDAARESGITVEFRTLKK